MVVIIFANYYNVYVVGGGIKWEKDDRDLVNRFLDDQSVIYTCGTDNTINFTENNSEKREIDKRSFRSFIYVSFISVLLRKDTGKLLYASY